MIFDEDLMDILMILASAAAVSAAGIATIKQ